MEKQKENLTNSTAMELSPVLVAGVGAAVESIECPYCNGDGFTSEHANHPHEMGECEGQCPIAVPCGYCYGDGRVTTKLMKEHIEESRKPINDDDLPF